MDQSQAMGDGGPPPFHGPPAPTGQFEPMLDGSKPNDGGWRPSEGGVQGGGGPPVRPIDVHVNLSQGGGAVHVGSGRWAAAPSPCRASSVLAVFRESAKSLPSLYYRSEIKTCNT